MAFQKYQGEQVQQIPAGYVEAMGSMGKAYANIGQSIAGGIIEADKRAQEEAKIQGALSPYLRNDKRTQAVESALSTGLLKKDAEGNVIVPEENANKLDLATATSAIDFYNKTGGDGSKLKGADLTRFATQFEAQRKYEADEAAKEDKRVERLKTLAEIRKMDAEAKSKENEAAAGRVLTGYAAGTPLESPSAVPAVSLNLPTVTAPTYDYNSPIQTGASGNTYAMPSFRVDRYNAGEQLAGQLGSAPAEATPVVSTAKAAPAPATTAPATTQATPGRAALPIPTVPQGTTVETIKAVEAERQVLTERYQTSRTDANAEHSRRMIALQKTGGATPAMIKQSQEILNSRLADLDAQLKANQDLLDKRFAAATTTSSEIRSEQAAGLAVKADTRAEEQLKLAKAADERAVAEGRMKLEEYELKYGKPVAGGDTTGLDSSKLKPGTFARSQAVEREAAAAVPGRTGGAYAREQEQKVAAQQNKMKSDYPANWGIGVFHDGAKQYQLDLLRFPTATAVDGANVGKVQEAIDGYSTAQSFLQQLNDLAESTDPNAIQNYLNRMLPTAAGSAKVTLVTGEMMAQFGVAAFRRAIVSGGNFSDSDKQFVAKMITDINSLNPLKDRDLMISQTRALAQFMDSKFRAELAGFGVRFDTTTAREFLAREGDKAGLKQLEKTEQYVRTFGIDQAPIATTPDYSQKMLRAIENAKAAGNTELVKQLTAQRDAYMADLDRKAEVANAAKKNANK